MNTTSHFTPAAPGLRVYSKVTGEPGEKLAEWAPVVGYTTVCHRDGATDVQITIACAGGLFDLEDRDVLILARDEDAAAVERVCLAGYEISPYWEGQ